MPRVGQVKASDDERLTDRIAIGVLTSMFPPALVDEVLETTGRVEQRHRLLPARVVVYFTLAMCLWADEGYEEVARLLVGGLKGMGRWRGACADHGSPHPGACPARCWSAEGAVRAGGVADEHRGVGRFVVAGAAPCRYRRDRARPAGHRDERGPFRQAEQRPR